MTKLEDEQRQNEQLRASLTKLEEEQRQNEQLRASLTKLEEEQRQNEQQIEKLRIEGALPWALRKQLSGAQSSGALPTERQEENPKPMERQEENPKSKACVLS